MKPIFQKWLQDTEGATVIEYALIAVGVALAVSMFIYGFGEELYAFFGTLTDAIT